MAYSLLLEGSTYRLKVVRLWICILTHPLFCFYYISADIAFVSYETFIVSILTSVRRIKPNFATSLITPK